MPSAMDSKTLVLISTLFLLSAFTVVPNLSTNLSEVIRGSFIPELLTGFGLPKGLFPSAASKYTLTYSSPEKLTVEMGVDPCIVSLPSVKIRYEKTSSATIRNGRLEDVTGIQMQMWVQVEKLWVDGRLLGLRIREPLYLDLNDFIHIPDCSRPELAVLKESGVSSEEYIHNVAVAEV